MITDNPGYGIRNIKKALLEKYDLFVGRDRLGKLLNLWGLNLKRKVNRRKPTFIQKVLKNLGHYSNLLIKVVLSEPFQAMTSDITKITYGGGIAYMCVHKDAYGQMVYGYKLGLNQTKELVINSYKQARQRIRALYGNIPTMICHQDQGSQYTSYDYVNTVQKHMVLSYSKKGTPTDNPGQESFFGRFKDLWKQEMLEIRTFEELEVFIAQKVDYYNNTRYHNSLGRVPPLEYTKSFLNFKNSSSA